MKIGFIGARGIPHGYSSAEKIALHVGKRLRCVAQDTNLRCIVEPVFHNNLSGF